MYFLPECYVQRQDRIFNSSKDRYDFSQRNYLVNLIKRLKGQGYLPVISGLDTFIPMMHNFKNEIVFVDYGYNVELAKNFSSSVLKVDFERDGYPSDAFKNRNKKKAIILLDILGEVADPEHFLKGVKESISEFDLFFIISPERDSQKNKNLNGPPSVGFRMREWNLVELKNFVSSFFQLDSLSAKLLRQHLDNNRKDLIVSNCEEIFLNDIDDSKVINEQCTSNFAEISIEESGFSFELPIFKKEFRSSPNLSVYYSTQEVKELIINRLNERLPCSLIRVGHAEVRTLGFPDFVNPVWASRSLNVCFGSPDVSSVYNKLKNEMLTSFQNADILGVPSTLEKDQHWRNSLPLLSFYNCELENKLLVSQNVHLQLLELGGYDDIISAAGHILIVGCRDLRSKIEKKYKVDVDFISIPGEAKFVDNSVSHYPDCYDEIKCKIMQSKAPLVLVGAGLAGNVYCDVARNNGAISIDIGSVMDIWAGANTRSIFEKYGKHILK